MGGTDFFDDDLVKPRGSAAQRAPAKSDGHDGTSSRTAEEMNLSRMAQRRDEINGQVAQAMEELERLRTRQEDLEREKQDLELLRRKQQEYEDGKRDLISHLNKSLVRLEKEEMGAQKLTEVLGTTRVNFRALLSEVEGLDEESWPDDSVREELDKALTRIEQVRIEYNKALSRVDSATDESGFSSTDHRSMALDARDIGSSGEHGFGYWLKVGFAVSLPLLIVVVVVSVVSYLIYAGILNLQDIP
jgi:chromosome segregation ATPase